MEYQVEMSAAALRSKLTIVLDENLLMLKSALKASGFKVLVFKAGTQDEDMWEQMEGYSLLTKNSKDFVSSAVIYDFDIIAIESIKFLDDEPTRKNNTVAKIADAIRGSKFYNMRGHFLLKVFDDGTYDLENLV